MTLVNRPNVKHAQIAARLKARPGVEMPVGQYVDEISARAMVRHIRTGSRLPAYRPAGAFKARHAPGEDGLWEVHARYIGTSKEGAA